MLKNQERTRALLSDPSVLQKHVAEILVRKARANTLFPPGIARSSSTSAVLFPLGNNCAESLEPCVLLNKRSILVKQPGDLCFPGGSTAPLLDTYLSKLLTLPLSPLARWPYWPQWREEKPHEARRMALLLATSLRESFEENRLNPFRVKFLGPLPSHDLSMFHRVIFPMVGWISRQKRFSPNWEVDKIVHIPLREMLDPSNYACYRLRMGPDRIQDFPCFRHRQAKEEEFLWGATYSIVAVFLELVFGFKPPAIETLPVISGSLDEAYLQGTA